MKFTTVLKLGFLAFTGVFAQVCKENNSFTNGCIQFVLGSGTGCAWACNYCANQLGTNNYYFNPPICTYESGGCVGNPQAGVSYTCCAL